VKKYFDAKQYQPAVEAIRSDQVESDFVAESYYASAGSTTNRKDTSWRLILLMKLYVPGELSGSTDRAGLCPANLKHYDACSSCIPPALRVKPDSATAFYEIGWIYNDQEKYARLSILEVCPPSKMPTMPRLITSWLCLSQTCRLYAATTRINGDSFAAGPGTRPSGFG